jgi:hypothetical protein
MASLALRTAIYAAWPILTPGLRYIATENKDLPRNPPLVLPDVWGTVGFDQSLRRILTMGANPWIEETGLATIVILARSGHGDMPGVSAADAVMRAWDGWSTPDGNVWFQNVGSPDKLAPEAEGEWFMYGVRCDYRVQERVALP